MATSSSTHDVISSERVEGTNVYNSVGDKLGTIDHLIINKKSGQVSYAVMEFGGLFGMGADRYPIPWGMLQYDTTKDGYVVPLDEAQLAGAPRYSIDEAPKYDEAYDSSVRTYYGF
jgi:sporulation protein YlmC with PRC-barrel domain